MTGGLARIWILGRNSPINEPWPDVIGVIVVLIVTGMFMLGLENTKVFSLLMVIGVLGLSAILSVSTWLFGTVDEWNKPLLPSGTLGVLTSAAISSYGYPPEMPSNGNHKRFTGILIFLTVFLSNILIAGCLSTMIEFQ